MSDAHFLRFLNSHQCKLSLQSTCKRGPWRGWGEGGRADGEILKECLRVHTTQRIQDFFMPFVPKP